MSEFKIESNIDVPSASGVGRPAKYPFKQLAIGDSFFVPKELAKKAKIAAHQMHNRSKIRMKTRTQPCGGIRIWRVE